MTASASFSASGGNDSWRFCGRTPNAPSAGCAARMRGCPRKACSHGGRLETRDCLGRFRADFQVLLHYQVRRSRDRPLDMPLHHRSPCKAIVCGCTPASRRPFLDSHSRRTTKPKFGGPNQANFIVLSLGSHEPCAGGDSCAPLPAYRSLSLRAMEPNPRVLL
jgi:hypothetical protein